LVCETEIATPAFGGLATTEGVLARLPKGKPWQALWDCFFAIDPCSRNAEDRALEEVHNINEVIIFQFYLKFLIINCKRWGFSEETKAKRK
jgi:hypothetical protein